MKDQPKIKRRWLAAALAAAEGAVPPMPYARGQRRRPAAAKPESSRRHAAIAAR